MVLSDETRRVLDSQYYKAVHPQRTITITLNTRTQTEQREQLLWLSGQKLRSDDKPLDNN